MEFAMDTWATLPSVAMITVDVVGNMAGRAWNGRKEREEGWVAAPLRHATGIYIICGRRTSALDCICWIQNQFSMPLNLTVN